MSENKALCSECREMKTYNVVEGVSELTFKGISFTTPTSTPHCSSCDAVVYVASLHDKNIEELTAAYNAAKNQSV